TLLLIALTVASASGAAGQPILNPPPPSEGSPPPLSPAAAALLATLQTVCLPALSGHSAKLSATKAGFRLKDGLWVERFSGERRLELPPPDAANPHICSATMYATPAAALGFHTALAAWAGAQTPPLKANADDASVSGPNHDWETSAWSGPTSKGLLGV